LRAAIADAGDEVAALVDGLAERLGPLAAVLEGKAGPLGGLIDAHVAAAEALAESDAESGAARLWEGDSGEALAGFVDELRQASAVLPATRGRDYPALLDVLIAGRVVRPRYGRHPRLNIWGPLEARLQHADLMILGGLNEGTWPPEPAADPWMSRPMREKFGLPPAERRIGLAAHDFAQAMAAPRVALVRAARKEGAPSVPSRWLTRLDTVLGDDKTALSPAKPWPALYHALARPETSITIAPPAPCPPLDARPRTLSVTRIEMWMRDPYAIYASRILGLKALDAIEADPGAADRGTFIHQALDVFIREHPGELPADALERLIACGEAAFGAAMDRPAVRAFWWPRFLRIADWFLATETERRAAVIDGSLTEGSGEYRIEAPGGRFTLTAKADRIDRLKRGGAAIIDYKTGTTPSDKMVRFGYSPQLPLEAVILAAGGFAGVPAGEVAELAYWRLTGGAPPGEIRPVKGDIAELVEQARRGLADLVAAFDDPATPYHATPRPRYAPAYNDYLHLARTAEWSAGGPGDGD
jgi:ATP-dependent helicase/nuclease subunit B